MISYIFTKSELRYFSAVMRLDILPVHMIDGENIGETELIEAEESLIRKGFLRRSEENKFLDAGIDFLLRAMGSAERIFLGDGERKFIAYIGECAVLLEKENSGNFLMSPFQTEEKLVSALNEKGIYEWTDRRLE